MEANYTIDNCAMHQKGNVIRVSNYEDRNNVVNMRMSKQRFLENFLPQYDLGIWKLKKAKNENPD